MFNRILVAVDNSEDSRHVFETALSLAKAADTRLLLLHVLPPQGINGKSFHLNADSTIGSQVQFCPPDWQSDEAKGWQILRSLLVRAADRGITADLALLRGELSQIIYQEACRWGADLIVIGQQEPNEPIADRIKNYATYHALCSVLIVQHQSTAIAKANQVKQLENYISDSCQKSEILTLGSAL